MTLEQRAALIADKFVTAFERSQMEAFALRMLREAVDEALRRAGAGWPSGKEMSE